MPDNNPLQRYKTLEKVYTSIKKLPGIGPRSARKLAIFLAENKDTNLQDLKLSIDNMIAELKYCDGCSIISDESICWRCSNKERNGYPICVVDNHLSIFAIEDAQVFNGNFHLLTGKMFPNNSLEVEPLIKRVVDNKVAEVIIALDFTYAGQLAADYINRRLMSVKKDLKVSRLASGVPVGGELTYTDEGTLQAAFNHRILID